MPDSDEILAQLDAVEDSRSAAQSIPMDRDQMGIVKSVEIGDDDRGGSLSAPRQGRMSDSTSNLLELKEEGEVQE